MTMPTSVQYGQVKWKAVSAVVDTADDADALPDPRPVTGTVLFKPSPTGPLLSPGTTPPVTVFPTPVRYSLNASGVLVDDEGRESVTLIATDSAGLTPVNWTWTATYNLADGLVMGSFSFSLPAGSTVDLTTVTPVSSSNGTPVLQGPKGDTGRGFTPRGEYSALAAGAQLNIDDIVTLDGRTYRITSAITKGSPQDTWAAYEIWAQKGDVGPQGTGVPSGGTTGQVVYHNGTTTEWKSASVSDNDFSTLVLRDGTGWFGARGIYNLDAPIGSGDAARKSYVDALGTTAATPSTIMRRDVNGDTSVDTVWLADAPTNPAQATRKDYVDGLVAGAEGYKVHDGSVGGGIRPTGYARIVWMGGTARPQNMAVGDIWERDA